MRSEAEHSTDPKGLCSRSVIVQNQPYFVTIRDPSKRLSTCSKVHDHFRKVSRDYLIVRENNVVDDGVHFHVLASFERVPHKGWYRKGVHIFVERVAPPCVPDGVPLWTHKWTLGEILSATDDVADQMLADNASLKHMMGRMRRCRLKTIDANVARVTRYMEKYLPVVPVQYEDYIFVVRGRLTKYILLFPEAPVPSVAGTQVPTEPACVPDTDGTGAEGPSNILWREVL